MPVSPTSQSTQSRQTASAASENRSSNALSSHPVKHHQIVVVGGGAAGITVAAQLLKCDRGLDIAIIDPSDRHYYQPGWTLVGGGIAPLSQFVRDRQSTIPKGASWIQACVAQLDPDRNTVITEDNGAITYDYLILCPGIQIDWHAIEGLEDALGKNGVTSNYSKDYAPYTWETIQNFQGGNAIFTYPATPIKCGGAPQKVMYMADDVFKSKSGVGVNTQVMFCTAGTTMFSVPEYAASLDKIVARRGIMPWL
jgi:sulfide:quinone oxidoreductase